MRAYALFIAAASSLLGLCGCGGGGDSDPPQRVSYMEDLGPAIFTLMEVDDSTSSDRGSRAPLLTVTYH